MNQSNDLNGYETTDPPREWNIQHPAAPFKSRTSDPKTIPVVSDIMGRLNHHATDNGDVEVHISDFPAESKSEYISDPDTTPIKLIDDDEKVNLLEFF